MTIKLVGQLDDTLTDDAWGLYEAAFTDLNTLAVQRHLMTRAEFVDVALDDRVGKYLCLDDAGAVCGLATYTNALDAVPLISPPYFARRWPYEYAAGRIWYVGFVAVADGAPLTVFGELIGAMHHTSGTDAITVLDVCTRTEQVRHLPRSVRVLLTRISGARVGMERLDEQSYWAYQFTPVGGR